jgi:hypothetical protein
LADHANVGDLTLLNGLHKVLGARASNGTQVLNQIGLGHTNTGIADGELLVFLVSDQLDFELRFAIQDGLVLQREVSNLVQSIRSVRDQLAQENFLVRVESVDDQGHQLIDLGLESVGFS